MWAVLRDGIRIWALAPIIPALVVLPEFAQHVAEIQLGMFESREAGRVISENPTRMAFGAAKLAGLLLAILATIRFWGADRTEGRWWNLASVAWAKVAVAIVLIALAALPGTLLRDSIGEEKAGWIDMALGIATLPLLVLLVRGISGDRVTGLRDVFRDGWFAAIRLLVFTAMVWIPLQFLHGKNHDWAFGAPEAAVWSLLIFDSLAVGLLATLGGTAMHHAAQRWPREAAPSRPASHGAA